MGEDIEGGHVWWVGTLRGSCGVGEDVLGGYPGKFPKVLSFMKVSGKFNTYQNTYFIVLYIVVISCSVEWHTLIILFCFILFLYKYKIQNNAKGHS